MNMKKLCVAYGCFNAVDYDPVLGDIVIMGNGEIHPLSMKCCECRTDAERKTLKNCRKSARRRKNKK